MESLVKGYNYLFFEATDPRTKDWLLYGHPYKLFGIAAIYMWFVLKAGPAFMQNRKPYKIEGIISVYNLLQVAMNFYVFQYVFVRYFGPSREYNLICNPLNFEDTPRERNHLVMGYIYVLLKLLDLLDTVFFVLRKKQSQITFLHIYHHVAMLISSALGHQYWPNGTSAFMVMFNCFVHVVMYIYYFLTSRDSSYRHVWWKKYLTVLQIVQFFSCMVVFSLAALDPNCKYPLTPSILLIIQSFVFTYMFTKFYINVYIKGPKRQETLKNK